MVLELHVWGPAFSLPSVEAQCLATIAYCSLVLPKDAWVLVASSDPSVSPTYELPALKNGSTRVSRFRNIVDYLRQYSNGEWDLDRDLSSQQRADNIAFSSFLESRAQPLLDLSLYVTSQNYYKATSPAYGALLHWPNQWILPPRLHAAAKSRTTHLGLSSLDLDAIEEQRKRDLSAAVAAGQVPQSFLNHRAFMPRDSLSATLSRSVQQHQFRLEALTADLFDPLEAIIADKPYLLTQESQGPTSLDCAATGYLALALVPDLPYPWLRDAMRTKAPKTTKLVDRLRKHCFGEAPISISDAYLDPSSSSPTTTSTTGTSTHTLPWRAPDRPHLLTVGYTLYDTVAESIPILRDVRMNERLKQAAQAPSSGLSGVESQTLAAYATGQKRDTLMSVAAVVGGVAALIGYMVHVGTISFGSMGDEDEEYEEEGEYEELTPEEIDPEKFQVGDMLAGL